MPVLGLDKGLTSTTIRTPVSFRRGRRDRSETGTPAQLWPPDRLQGAALDAAEARDPCALQGLGARARVVARLPALDDARLHAPVLGAVEVGAQHPALPAVRARRPRRVGVLPGLGPARERVAARQRGADHE